MDTCKQNTRGKTPGQRKYVVDPELNGEKTMSAKPRLPPRLRPLSKTEFELPSKSPNSTKTQTQGRIRPKTVPAKTFLKENVRSKLSSAEKRSERKTNTEQIDPDKTDDNRNNNGHATVTKSLKQVDGKNNRENKPKASVTIVDEKKSKESVANDEKTSETEPNVVVDKKETVDTNTEQQYTVQSEETEVIADKIATIGVFREESFELRAVESGGDQTEKPLVKQPGSPENDLNSCENDSERTSTVHNEAQSNDCLQNSDIGVVNSCFSCSTESDVTTPWIGGLAVVKSGDVICLDLNNERIKRFDRKFKMVSSIEIPFSCCGMILTTEDEIAVTCLNEVHFYNVGKFGMNRTAKYFTINGMAHGIAHDQNWFAVTCDITEPDESSIRIIDETGSERYVIDPPIVSRLPLKLTSFIEIDRTLGCVFLSESAPSRVVCLNFDGEALWDTAIPGGARGVTSIGAGNILVCDQFSEKIRLLSKHGVLKTSVISSEDGLRNPDFIARKPDTNDVIVSYGGFGTIGLFTPLMTSN